MMTALNNIICVLMIFGVFFTAGCGSLDHKAGVCENKTPVEDLNAALDSLCPETEQQRLVKTGMQKLTAKDYEGASDLFSKGLRLDPANGYLHFLNAMTYHLRAGSGNARMLQLAKSGYATALKFDNANYMAAYLLGQIDMEQKQFADAQNHFAYGLLYAPDNLLLLRAMAAASYYNRDLEVCRWAAEKAYETDPQNPDNIRNLMFSRAASGGISQARELLPVYSSAILDLSPEMSNNFRQVRLDSLAGRLDNWNAFYAANSIFGNPVGTNELINGPDAADDEWQKPATRLNPGTDAGKKRPPPKWPRWMW